MIIGTNMPALIANKYMERADRAASNAMYKLSSGKRINSAKDDPSGMAISKKIKMQLKGLEAASMNSTNGISVTQTADGALSEMTDIMQRVRELAVHAANETLTLGDREIIQQEINELLAEVDNIAATTNFNGINLLDGSIQRLSYLSGGYGIQDLINGNKVSTYYLSSTLPAGDYDFNVNKVGMPAYYQGHPLTSTTAEIGMKGVISINGEPINIEETDTWDDIYAKLKEVCDAAEIDVVLDPAGYITFATREAGSDQHIKFNGDEEILDWLGLVDIKGVYNNFSTKTTPPSPPPGATPPGTGIPSTGPCGMSGDLLINGRYIYIDATDEWADIKEKFEKALPDFEIDLDAAGDITITAREKGADYPLEIDTSSTLLTEFGLGGIAGTPHNVGVDIVMPTEVTGTDAEFGSQAVINGGKILLAEDRQIGLTGSISVDFSLNGTITINVEATDTWEIIYQKLITACEAKNISVSLTANQLSFESDIEGVQLITFTETTTGLLAALGLHPHNTQVSNGTNPDPATDTPATVGPVDFSTPPNYIQNGDAEITIGIATIHIKDGDTMAVILEKIRKACEAQDLIFDIDYVAQEFTITTKNAGSGASLNITHTGAVISTFPGLTGSFTGTNAGSTTPGAEARYNSGTAAPLLNSLTLDGDFGFTTTDTIDFFFVNDGGTPVSVTYTVSAGDTWDDVWNYLQTNSPAPDGTIELIDGRLVLKSAETGSLSTVEVNDGGNGLAEVLGLTNTTAAGIDNGINGPAGYDHNAIVTVKGNLITVKGKDGQEMVLNLEVATELKNDGTLGVTWGTGWRGCPQYNEMGNGTNGYIDANPNGNYGEINKLILGANTDGHSSYIKFSIESQGPMHIQTGSMENTHMFIDIPAVNLNALGVSNLSLRTSELAQRAIVQCDYAQEYLLKVRTKVGAYENRLETTVKNLDTSILAAETSKSKIEDTDMALMMTLYTQQSVIVQAGLSVLAQANQRPSYLLQILQ